MIYELVIENFILIEKQQVVFGDGLNIITGETGAGKSIIFDAIRVLLGQSPSKDKVRKGADKFRIEAVFQSDDLELAKLLTDNDILIEDEQIIISRVFDNKKSIIRVNGRTCLSSFVKKLGEYLIDFHGQRDNSILLNTNTHLDIIDQYALDIKDDLKQIEQIFYDYNRVDEKIKDILDNAESIDKKLDFINYQIDEIEKANLIPDEDVEIESRLKLLRNSEYIYKNLMNTRALFTESMGIIDLSDKMLANISQVKEYDSNLDSVYDLAQEMSNIADEINIGIRNYLDSFELDEEELYNLESRIDVINNLKLKYGSKLSDILDLYQKLVDERTEIINSEKTLIELNKRKDELKKQYDDKAKKVSEKRKFYANEIQIKVESILDELNIKGGKLKFVFDEEPIFSKRGFDNVQIYALTNVGEDFKPIKKIASGGEISRIMLALKSILNKNESKVLIYDEIDTGISGNTAEVVAQNLYKLSTKNQIISVTHLPQIAVFGDTHIIISKNTDLISTTTEVIHANEEQIKLELSRLIAGTNITENTLKHVTEMVNTTLEKKQQC